MDFDRTQMNLLFLNQTMTTNKGTTMKVPKLNVRVDQTAKLFYFV